MLRPLKLSLFLALSTLLAACASSEVRQVQPEILTPLPMAANEPSDAQLAAAVASFLKDSNAPASSLYHHRRMDLNGDGRRDALVILKNPYGYWCGLYGCTMLVMEAKEDSFKLVNAIQTVREPVFISDEKSNGWKDIIIHVSGRWTETKDVALQYDGNQYPGNPSELPPYLNLAAANTRLFHE